MLTIIFRPMLCAKASFLCPLMKTNSYALSKSLSTVSRFHHYRLAPTSFLGRGNYIHDEIHKSMDQPEIKQTRINKRGNDEMETELFQSACQTKAHEKLEHIVESTNILTFLRKRNSMSLCVLIRYVIHPPNPNAHLPRADAEVSYHLIHSIPPPSKPLLKNTGRDQQGEDRVIALGHLHYPRGGGEEG